MSPKFLAVPVILILIFGTFSLPLAHAQFQSGGVDKEGSWYVGEGLKKGNYFSYELCHVDYKECSPFEIDFWIKGDRKVGTEDKWVAEVVVYDGNSIVTGEFELGKIAPEPTGGNVELSKYRNAFKSSIVWLSAFATSYGGDGGEGPKEFSAKSWGKIGNIGGEQVLPTSIEDVTVPEGTFEESVLVTWRTGGYTSKVWVVDEFPFPVKASTFTHVSEGIPPPEYQYQLLDYKENIEKSPFSGIIASEKEFEELGCPPAKELKASIKKPTKNFSYQIHAFYTPEEPVQGCPMKWLIKFISKYDDTEFLNQVQYDLMVVNTDSSGKPLLPAKRTISNDEGREFLYSPSGQALIDMIVREEPGPVNYLVMVYGLSPENIKPSAVADYLLIPLTVKPLDGAAPTINVPEWVKDNAGAWANNEISTELYVTGLQYLIDEGVITIPPTSQGQGTENTIPEWVKDNAGSWANNDISTELYVTGLQYLIEQGVMKIKNEQPAKQSVKDAKLASLEEQLEQCSEITKAYSRIQCEKEAEAKILRYEYETTGTAYKVGPITYYYSGNEFEISDQGQALLTLKLLAVNTDSTDNVTLMCTGPAICNYDVTNGDKIFKYASTDFTSGSITLKPDGSKEFEMFFGPNIGYGGTKFEYDPNKDYYFRINESFGSTSIPLNLG